MALGTFSVCLTVLVLNLHHRDLERPVPRWVRLVVLHWLSKVLWVRARKPKTMAINLKHDATSGATVTGVEVGLRQLALDRPMLHAVATPNGHVIADRLVVPVDHLDRRRSKSDHSHEWKEVAHVLDRLFFAIVFASMSASAMIILLVPYYKEELHP